MSFTAARVSILKFFSVPWAARIPVAYDDVDFTIPSPPSIWARFNVKHFNAYQSSIGDPGANKFRRQGMVTVQIFAPEKGATQDAVAKGDEVVSLFEGKTRFEGVIFSNVRMTEVGPDGMGWYQVNVKIDFEYDDLA